MRVYRIAWSLIWGALAAASIALACIAWVPGGVVIIYLMSAFVIGCAAELLPRERGTDGFARSGLPGCFSIGAWGGAVAVAVFAVADTVGVIAWLLLAVAGVSSPPVLRWAVDRTRARRRSRRLSSSVTLSADHGRAWEKLVRGELARLSDADLCWGWRVSYQALNERRDAGWRGQVVSVREAYLAELEKRHPVEIAAWLATNPLPANGPERFLGAA